MLLFDLLSIALEIGVIALVYQMFRKKGKPYAKYFLATFTIYVLYDLSRLDLFILPFASTLFLLANFCAFWGMYLLSKKK